MSGIDVASEIVSEFASTDTSVSPVHDGVNTLAIFSSNGRKYVIKVGTCNSDAVYLEGHLMRSLNDSDIPTPCVHEVGQYKGESYFIADFIGGRQLPYPQEMDTSQVVKWSQSMGRILAQLQQYKVPVGELRFDGSSFVSSSHRPWRQYLRSLLDEYSRDARKNYPEHARRATRLIHWCEIPQIENNVSLCPLDMHTHNLFVNDDQVTGLIDLERCYGGHPSWGYQVVQYMLCLGRETKEVSKIRDSFKQGYETVADSPKQHPVFLLSAVIREMRAAHMWWENPESRSDHLRTTLDSIESEISE